MTDYKGLIAEADVRVIRAETQMHSTMGDTDLIHRLAVAVREAAAHVPPEGWTLDSAVYSREDGAFVQKMKAGWIACNANKTYVRERYNGPARAFPTPAAAMAALEKR